MLSTKALIGIALAAIILAVLGVGFQSAAQSYRLRTTPHHWYALKYTTVHRGGRRSDWFDHYLQSAVGPFPSEDSCKQRIKNDAYFTCIDSVDADVQPRDGYVETPEEFK